MKSPLRVVVCGMGKRGVGMTRAFRDRMPEIRIVGLVEKNARRLELARDYLALEVPVYQDTGACVEATAPDAVMVFTTDAAHPDSVIPALERDMHVFCEKPMATSLDACDRMIAAARTSRGLFYMGFNMRHAPYFSAIHDLLEAGEIGEPMTIACAEYYYGGRTYFRRWNRLKQAGGGLWITKATHDFDMMSWLARAEPASLFAVGGRRLFQPREGAADRCRDCALAADCPDFTPLEPHPDSNPDRRFWHAWREAGVADGELPADACLYRADIETVDHGIVTLNYANGVCATYTMNVATTPQLSGRWITIVGTRGALTADPQTHLIKVSFRAARAPRVTDVSALVAGGHGGADERIVSDFVAACRGGRQPAASWADGRRAVEMGLAATHSQECGVRVTFPFSTGSDGASGTPAGVAR